MIVGFKISGKAKAVFPYLDMLAKTELIEADPYWWGIRLWLSRN